MKFLSLDSGFHKYGTILFDLIALSVLWFLTVFGTFGLLAPLANTAIFNSINHTLILDDGYMTRSYFIVFKTKILKSLGLTLVGIVLFGVSLFNIWTVYSGIFQASFLLPLYIMFLSEVTITMLYASALLAETDMTIKQLMKYGFLLSNKHFLMSLGCLAGIFAVVYLGVFQNPIFFFIGTAPLFWLFTWLIYAKVFNNYHLEKLV